MKAKGKLLLRVETDRYVAGCVWGQCKNQWLPTGPCAPILLWMIGRSCPDILARLKAMKASWEWINIIP